MYKSDPYTIQFGLISFLLLVLIFKWIHYLYTNNYVQYMKTKEGMVSDTKEDEPTTQTVNMPLNTTFSCKNMCGPPNRCSITGQQCMADIDCPGCEPPATNTSDDGQIASKLVGENDSGKLTTAMTPNYSELTSDIGSRARLITADKYEKSISPYAGINTWVGQFNLSRKLFDDRYRPAGLKGMPSYRTQHSLSGAFDTDGPLASNSYLS